MTDAAKIARGLTKAQREALAWFGGEWSAGPYLPDFVLDEETRLREQGLVKREFGDMGPPETSEMIDGFSISIGCCWWFHITDDGLAVRAELERTADE